MTVLYLAGAGGDCRVAFGPDGGRLDGAAADRQFRLGRYDLDLFARPGRRRQRAVAARRAPRPMRGNGWWRRWSRSGRCGSGSHIAIRTRRDHRRSALCRLCQGMGHRFAAQDVHLPAEAGARLDPAGVRDLRRRAHARRRACGLQDYLGALILLVGIAGEALADAQLKAFRDRSRQQGQGLRRRAVALVAPSELFLRMVRLARLSGDRASFATGLSVGVRARCWRRSSCTGSWSTSPAFRRSKRRCCARAAIAIAPISRAPAGSFRCRRKTHSKASRVAMSLISHASSAPPNGCRCRMRSSAPRSTGCARAPRRGSPTGNAETDAWFADAMAARAIAEYTDAANAQHYEVPAAFFAHGARAAPQIFLVLLQRAGHDVAGGRGRGAAPDRRACRSRRRPGDPRTRLRLGFAVAVDGAAVSRMRASTAVSNSHSQREYIESEAAKRGLTNLRSSPPT